MLSAAAIFVLWLDREVLERRGVSKTGDLTKPGLADPRANPVQKTELPDRRIDRFLVNELLHLGQHRCAFFVIEFVRLLGIGRVDIGIAAIGEGAILDDKRGEPRRGVAKGAARTLDNALRVFLAGISGEEAGPLDRFELGANSDLAEIVDRDLGHVRGRAIAIE